MKGLCYVALILVFIMFYNKNQVYCLVVVGLFIGVFLFFKSRKYKKNGNSFRTFFSGRVIPEQNNYINEFLFHNVLKKLNE